jgi:TolB-like protein/Tfp pilus assembly protein PilF
LAVAAFAAGVSIVFLASRMAPRQRVTAQHEITSIAVLPLENLTGDSTQEYFVDGIGDLLTTELARFHSLRVIARSSVMRFKGARKSVPEIASALKVDAVVEGTVFRSGDRLRLTLQLIEANSNSPRWAGSFESSIQDVMQTQFEAARTLAHEIRAAVPASEYGRLSNLTAIDPRAYDAYLYGRFFWNQRTLEGMKKANENFHRAISLEPKYAPAYAGLADVNQFMVTYGAVSPREGYEAARAMAITALEIDPELAEAHTSLASIREDYDWDWLGADREYQKAIELNPNYATAHHWYSDFLGGIGKEQQAIAEATAAHDLDPLSPVILVNLGEILCSNQQYDLAIRQFQRAVELDPQYYAPHNGLGRCYARMGKYSDTLAEAKKEVALLENRASTNTAYLYAVGGEKKQALEIVRRIEGGEVKNDAYTLACVYAALGNNDRALQTLEKAYELHDSGLLGLRTDDCLDGLRADPQFQAILGRMNFPPE